MVAKSKEELHRLVNALPEDEVQTVRRILEALVHPSVVPGGAFFAAERSVAAPAGDEAGPITDIDELRGDFWPEDEGPDEFVNAVREWRHEGTRV